jgi:hypothetical protein
MKLNWNPDKTPQALHSALRLLADEYPLHEARGNDSANLTFVPGPETVCGIRQTDSEICIAGGSTAAQLRAVGSALSGLPGHGASIEESCPFSTIGIMLDCSRNAVMNVAHVKQWLRRLALLGYNQVMLYTEDTYEIPGEPRFGYQRGRYSQAELRELDAYAAGLGMELVGCIQTLAHLQQILRWGEYQAIKDYESTTLVGEPKTYELIGKMLDAIGGALRTRRIHIGMDEAWALGRGAYLDKHGARRKFDIFNEHLAAVVKLCKERGLKPMIWSDMYFTMGSPSHGYFDTDCVIPPDVVAEIPKQVQLVYWDYCHNDAAFYRDWIGRHRAMGHEPVMASGVWTWSHLWYNRKLTEANAGACLEACRSEGLKEVFFTMWGDDGAYCDFDSALAGLAWAAESAYAPKQPDEARLRARFAAVCRADYAAVLKACELNENLSAVVIWDDPIIGIFLNEGFPPKDWPSLTEIQQRFARLAKELAGFSGQNSAGDLDHARLLADVLSRKIDLRVRLVAGYDSRDHAALMAVVKDALALAESFETLEASWRRGWMRRNKPQGYEVIQLRLALQAIRHRELARRIDELLTGAVAVIPELDERMREAKGMAAAFGWRSVATSSVSI